jgi:hypothetical protein
MKLHTANYNLHNHPAFRYPKEYSQRVYEVMDRYCCDHSDAEGIVEVEYAELGYIPKPSL